MSYFLKEVTFIKVLLSPIEVLFIYIMVSSVHAFAAEQMLDDNISSNINVLLNAIKRKPSALVILTGKILPVNFNQCPALSRMWG